MLGKIEGKRRRGQQSVRWLDSIIDSMDMNLSKLQQIVEDSLVCYSPWGCNCFPQRPDNLIFSPTIHEGSNSFASSPALTILFFFFSIVCLFYNNHPNQSEVNSHCSFDLHFPTGQWQSSIFSCAFWYIFAEMSIRVFCSLLNWLVVHC